MQSQKAYVMQTQTIYARFKTD